MSDIQSLEPRTVFDYFKAISDIPRGSGNTAAISAFLCRFAEERGLSYESDETGNVLIRKEATPGYELHDPVILQGHVDMVCVKTEDSDHDFEKDPIELIVDGEWLRADGTTLGGDDGIAVAYMLALLDADDIPHPALETLFTVDEETGMYGAKALDPSWITSRRMINLDSEEEGILTTGCAGGVTVECTLPIRRHALRGTPVRVMVGGLVGGHSGGAIQYPVASANKLMGRILKRLYDELPISLVDLSGGEKQNAIATSAEAVLLADEEDLDAIGEILAELEDAFRSEYQGADDDIYISCVGEEDALVHVMDDTSANAIINFLLLVPHGVEKMSAFIEGAVETSTNIGIIYSEENTFSAFSLTRSSVGSAKRMLAERIKTLAEVLGGSASEDGDYPAWEFKDQSALLEKICEVCERETGKEPVVTITHGGLECGLISDAIPDMEIVSMGPDMSAIHTSAEKLSIPSVLRVWELLKAILKDM